MKVRVLTLGKGDFEVELPSGSSVDALRKLVADKQAGSDTTRVRLMYRGRLLQDGSSLRSCGIEDGQTVHLVLRPAAANSATSQGASNQAGQGSTARPSATVSSTIPSAQPQAQAALPGQAAGGFSGAPLPATTAQPAAPGDVQLRVDSATINAARRLSSDTTNLRHSANRTPSVEIGAAQSALPNVVVASSLRNVHRFMHAVEPQVLNLAEAYHMIQFVPPGPQRDALQRSTFAVARELQSLANAANGMAQVLSNVRLGQGDSREFHLDPNMPVQWSSPAAGTQPPVVPAAPATTQAGPSAAPPGQVHTQAGNAAAGVTPSQPAVQLPAQGAAVPMHQLPAQLQQLLGGMQQAGGVQMPQQLAQGIGQLFAGLAAGHGQGQPPQPGQQGGGGGTQQ